MDGFPPLTACLHCSEAVRTLVLSCGHHICKDCLGRDVLNPDLSGCPLCLDEPMAPYFDWVNNYPGIKLLLQNPCKKCNNFNEIFAFCDGCGFICKACFTTHIEERRPVCNFSTARRREVTAAKNELIVCGVHQETITSFCLDCGILTCEKCTEEDGGSHKDHHSIALTKDIAKSMLRYFENLFEVLLIRREEYREMVPKVEAFPLMIDDQVQSALKKIESRKSDLVQMIESQASRLCDQLKKFQCTEKERLNQLLTKLNADVEKLDRFNQWHRCYEKHNVNEIQQLHMNINMEPAMYELSRQFFVQDLDTPILDLETLPSMNAVVMTSLGILREKSTPWPIRSLDEFVNLPRLPRATRLLQEFSLPGGQNEQQDFIPQSFGAIGEGRRQNSLTLGDTTSRDSAATLVSLFDQEAWPIDDKENQRPEDVPVWSISPPPRDQGSTLSNSSSDPFLHRLSLIPLSSRQQSSRGSSGSPDVEVPSQTGMELALRDLNIQLHLTDSIINRQTFQPVQPPNYLVQREQMRYYAKFGEFGEQGGQFSEPSGLAALLDGQIVVADTNSHRIQVFRNGQFHFQFGTEGRREGQFMYPNRVAVCPVTGTIVITERSPTHQIQIYTPEGDFVRKFGNQVLQHPRGVCVDKDGRIIVVECKVMRVVIFDPYGHVINHFKCERLQFPNSIAVDADYRIYICDNKAHSVLVFNYEGLLLGTIGNPGLTNYPIGVAVYKDGNILVADNHNNFNVTIFTPQGVRVRALESMVKHAQCLDIAMLEDGSMALACKDYRIYIYQFNI